MLKSCVYISAQVSHAMRSRFHTLIVVCSLTNLLLFSLPISAAEWAGNLEVRRLFNDDRGNVFFGTSSQPAHTCQFFSTYFTFKLTNPPAERLFDTLMAAKLSGSSVDVWYEPSTAPGTNQNNGCTESAVSKLTGIGFNR